MRLRIQSALIPNTDNINKLEDKHLRTHVTSTTAAVHFIFALCKTYLKDPETPEGGGRGGRGGGNPRKIGWGQEFITINGFLVGICCPLPKTLTLFTTKMSDFQCPMYDLTLDRYHVSHLPYCVRHKVENECILIIISWSVPVISWDVGRSVDGFSSKMLRLQKQSLFYCDSFASCGPKLEGPQSPH